MQLLRQKKYYLFFLFLIGIYFLIQPSLLFDSTWEYGMAHAIKIGEVPYLDFNMVTTPFYAFFHSVFLFIHDSFITYMFVNGMLYTFLYYLYDRLVSKRALFYLALPCIFLFLLFVPSYNTMAFLFTVLLLYLEKEKKSDSVIGIVLALLFLTKHTVGLSIIFFSFLGIRDFCKIKKRILSMMIVIVIFIVYLLLTGSFHAFIDLCFLGLFHFSSSNHKLFNQFFIVSILLLIISIYFCFKDKRIEDFYLLGSFSLLIPIFDGSHFVLFFLCFYYVWILDLII